MTMTMPHILRFGFGLVAALCIGAAAVTPSVATAQDGLDQGRASNGSASREVAQLKTSPPPSEVQPPSGAPKPDDQTTPKSEHAPSSGGSTAAPSPLHDSHSAEKGGDEHSDRGVADKDKAPPAKGPETPELHMKDLGPVDTRITVGPQPRRADDKKQNPLLHSPTGRRILPPHIRPPGTPPKRNSIGETLPSSGAPSQESSPGAGSPAIAARGGGAPGNTAIPPGNAALAPLHTRPVTAAPVAPRPTINGSNITRRGNAPAGIGGQAKPVAGINGSEIRPRH